MSKSRNLLAAALLTLALAACASPPEATSSGVAPGSPTRFELGGYYAMAGGAIVGRH